MDPAQLNYLVTDVAKESKARDAQAKQKLQYMLAALKQKGGYQSPIPAVTDIYSGIGAGLAGLGNAWGAHKQQAQQQALLQQMFGGQGQGQDNSDLDMAAQQQAINIGHILMTANPVLAKQLQAAGIDEGALGAAIGPDTKTILGQFFGPQVDVYGKGLVGRAGAATAKKLAPTLNSETVPTGSAMTEAAALLHSYGIEPQTSAEMANKANQYAGQVYTNKLSQQTIDKNAIEIGNLKQQLADQHQKALDDSALSAEKLSKATAEAEQYKIQVQRTNDAYTELQAGLEKAGTDQAERARVINEYILKTKGEVPSAENLKGTSKSDTGAIGRSPDTITLSNGNKGRYQDQPSKTLSDGTVVYDVGKGRYYLRDLDNQTGQYGKIEGGKFVPESKEIKLPSVKPDYESKLSPYGEKKDVYGVPSSGAQHGSTRSY